LLIYDLIYIESIKKTRKQCHILEFIKNINLSWLKSTYLIYDSNPRSTILSTKVYCLILFSGTSFTHAIIESQKLNMFHGYSFSSSVSVWTREIRGIHASILPSQHTKSKIIKSFFFFSKIPALLLVTMDASSVKYENGARDIKLN